MSNFFKALKDPAKLSQLVALLFFVGILSSAYALYQLPTALSLSGQDITLAWPQFLTVFFVVGATFVLGFIAYTLSLRVKKEVIVYLEKKRSVDASQRSEAGDTGESRDVSSFRTKIEQTKPQEVLQVGLTELCRHVEAGQGAVYLTSQQDTKRILELKSGFALSLGESQTVRFEFGEGLVGQAAASAKSLYLDEVPDGYIKVVSGLGSASPRYLFIMAIKANNEVKGVLELATFAALTEHTRKQLEEMGNVLAEKIS